MRITTWNVNSLRSFEDPLEAVLQNLNSDIICVQETKLTREALSSEIAFVSAYSSYFSFCRKKAGYSGVATYAANTATPEDAEEGFTTVAEGDSRDVSRTERLDPEGRILLTKHRFKYRDSGTGEKDDFVVVWIVNLYCPRFDPDRDDRMGYKMRFHRLMEMKAMQLLEQGCQVLMVGDMNISRSRMDHCDPDSHPDFDAQEHRIWFQNLVDSQINPNAKFVDLFRYFHPKAEKVYTCWNTKMGARETNFGTRIDYFLASKQLLDIAFFTDCSILTDILGSDHCPVQCVVNSDKYEPVASPSVPPLCSKLMPELRGNQQKLDNFLVKTTSNSEPRKEDRIPPKKRPKKDTKTTLDHFFGSKQGQKLKRGNRGDETVGGDWDLFSQGLHYSSCVSSTSVSSPCRDDSMSHSYSAPSETEKGESKPVSEWKELFKGPPVAPLCEGHQLKCLLRTVKKKGPNINRQFWVCSKPEGHKTDPSARCNFFKWN